MNLIFTRSRQEQINISWEPFATSTPLKIASNKQKTAHGLPKHLLTQTEPVNLVEKFLKGLVTSNTAPGQSAETKPSVTKRSKRNRLSAYFDVSLSSSEDDEDGGKDENKRPVIKLNSKKKTKTLLSYKLENEEPKALNNVNEDQSVSKSKKKKNLIKGSEKNVDSSVFMEPKNIQALIGDNKSKSVKQASVLENDSGSKDRGNQILEIERDAVKNTKCTLTNKENVLNDSNNEELRNLSKTFKKNTKRKDSKVLKKSVFKNNNSVLKSSPRATLKTNKTTINPKKKGSEADIESVRKYKTRKVNSKLSIQVDQKKAVTPLRIWDKTNLSHQLFSDSREQEFINTLDLTSEELNEGLKSIKSSLIQKQKNLVYPLTTAVHPSVTNQGNDVPKTKEDKQKQERPKRTKQRPKEFWITETSLGNPFSNTNENTGKRVKKNHKIPSKNEELVFKTESDTKSEIQEKCLEDLKDLELEKKVTREKSKVVKREKVRANDDALNKITKKVQTAESNCISSGSSQTKEVDTYTRPITESKQEAVVEEKKTITTNKIVFSLLNDLAFKDNGLGCSAAECWSTNNFKCGVFKLRENSQLSCKTLHKNSYLNGIVIKGTLMMKVGEEELKLSEGDMTFVPPLTKWQATNIGKCESVFYYWCGRLDN